MDSSLWGLRFGFDSLAADLEDATRFLGGPVASVRFRFFWDEGIVKKEDIVGLWGVFLPGGRFREILDEIQKLFFCRWKSRPLSV
jgi:hypothetical protein